MIRLLIVAIVAAAIRAQVALAEQYVPSCACGGPHPLYNLLPPSYRGKYPALIPKGPPVASVNPPPAPCSCGPYQLQAQPLSIAGPPGPPGPPGVLVYSPGPLPQAGPIVLQAPAPLGASISPPPPETLTSIDTSSSHIMTIPKKYPPDSTPTYTFTNSPVPGTAYSSNSIYAESAPSPATYPPHPLYYTQQASLISSCPATVVYPASTQPVSASQNPIASYSLTTSTSDVSPVPSPTPFYTTQSAPVYTQPGVTQSSLGNKSASIAAAAAAAGSSAASASLAGSVPKNPLLTYTLIGATKKKDGLPGSSLEAENNDCGMPGPPPTLLKST